LDKIAETKNDAIRSSSEEDVEVESAAASIVGDSFASRLSAQLNETKALLDEQKLKEKKLQEEVARLRNETKEKELLTAEVDMLKAKIAWLEDLEQKNLSTSGNSTESKDDFVEVLQRRISDLEEQIQAEYKLAQEAMGRMKINEKDKDKALDKARDENKMLNQNISMLQKNLLDVQERMKKLEEQDRDKASSATNQIPISSTEDVKLEGRKQGCQERCQHEEQMEQMGRSFTQLKQVGEREDKEK